ncbi:MAG: hypothetical protein K6B68_15065 [Eubacterium sp.]|nr:hypothetical protein [Eubacterium sp.]
MEEVILRLRNKIEEICEIYCDLNKTDLTEQVKFFLDDINKFSTWFIGAQDLGIPAEDKVAYNEDMLSILNDIMTAFEHRDSALVYDAIYCGLMDYLNMFDIEEEEADE